MSIKNESISEIIKRELAETTLKISPLVGKGFVNEVFFIETGNHKFIFRTSDADLLDEYEKELWSAKRAFEKTIPTPQILKIGVFKNHAFSIQPFVEGIEGRDFSGDKKFIWKKLGEYARKIHSVKIGGFGLKFCDMTHGNSEFLWQTYLNYNIESLNERDELLKLGVLTETQSKTVRNVFENLKSRKFDFGLNHGDLSLKNTIVDENGKIHLIDWGSAEASIVPHHDLIQLLKVNMQENDPDNSDIEVFLEDYGIGENQYEKLLPDLKSLSLLRSFDKLRWAIDQQIPELNEYILTAKETVKRFLL